MASTLYERVQLFDILINLYKRITKCINQKHFNTYLKVNDFEIVKKKHYGFTSDLCFMVVTLGQ